MCQEISPPDHTPASDQQPAFAVCLQQRLVAAVLSLAASAPVEATGSEERPPPAPNTLASKPTQTKKPGTTGLGCEDWKGTQECPLAT